MDIKIHNRIKELRNAEGITITELSKNTGFPQSTLTNYENGKRVPRDQDTWKKLADYFGVSVPYLMGLSSDPKNQAVSFDHEEFIQFLKDGLNEVNEKKDNEFLEAFHKLNSDGQKELLKYSNYLFSITEYQANNEIISKQIEVTLPKELRDKFLLSNQAENLEED